MSGSKDLGPSIDGSVVTVNQGTSPWIVSGTVNPAYGITALYNQVANVPANSSAQLITHTVPVGYIGNIQRVVVSGENIAKYDIKVNGSPISTCRTYFGGELNIAFDFTGDNSGLMLTAGEVISVVVDNFRPSVATFETTIQIIEVLL